VAAAGTTAPDARAAPGAGTPAVTDAGEPLLRLTGVSKRFTGVLALDGVDLDVRAGELHVLFGENGAGKSTLINVIAGTFPPDGGRFRFRGQDIHNLTPHRARVIGISPVFQEFSLVPSLTVEENLFLGREVATGGVLNAGRMRRRARDLIAELGFGLDPKRRVDDLSRAHQQMAEIAKALLGDVKLLILDEPTASLTERETGRLFELIARLKTQGVGIIYVSHRMREIRALADRITVLRDGRLVKTLDAAGVTDAELVELMTGRKIDVLFPTIAHRPGAVTVDVENLAVADGSVAGVDFHAHAGEVTGIAGLVGCGKSELVRAIYGLQPISDGRIRLHAVPHEAPSPRASLRRGLAYFPANRVAEGLALARPIRENASMAALDLPRFVRLGILNVGRERGLIQPIMDKLRLRPPGIERAVGNLSGGNRQKVMLGRALTRDLSIFLFDEPTVGIDVGAKLEVYEFIRQLVEDGATVVIVSSELPEVLALSNRLYVMHQGRMVAELAGARKTEQNVLASFFTDTRAADEPRVAVAS
jgi:ribose transport system ATP-binding protein